MVADRDPRPPLAEGGVHAHIGGRRVRLTEDGLEVAPHREWWVGAS